MACEAIDLSRYGKDMLVSGDLAGRDFSGENFRGKLFLEADLHGAKLHDADLTEALICSSDLSEADLSGARLDRATIGALSNLSGARLTGISGHALTVGDVNWDGMVLDNADLRDARIDCDPHQDFMRCISENSITIASVAKADLRGAMIRNLCCRTMGLESAKLDGAVMELPPEQRDFSALAAGVGKRGHITFLPMYGHDGEITRFTGEELQRLQPIIAAVDASPGRPSFACAHAAGAVEQLICRSPRLGALDAALDWIWRGMVHSEDDRKAQHAWLDGRVAAMSSTSQAEEKLMSYYARRIAELAPRAEHRPVAAGTYTPDPPLLLPAGADADLARKFLRARGFTASNMSIDRDEEPDNVSGYALGANFHECTLEPEDDERSHEGALTTVAFEDDKAAMILVVTPPAILVEANGRRFCGTRAGWHNFYFRQPTIAPEK